MKASQMQSIRAKSELGYQYTIFVKKKAGQLSYVQDPHSLQSLLTQTGASNASALDVIQSFTDDLRILGFAQYFCEGKSNRQLQNQCLNGTSLSQLYTDILYECLTQEKPESIALHVSLLHLLRSLEEESSLASTWTLRLVLDYYESKKCEKGQKDRQSLLNQEFLDSIVNIVDRNFNFAWNDVIKLMQTLPRFSLNDTKQIQKFYSFLIWNKIPPPFLQNGKKVRLDGQDIF